MIFRYYKASCDFCAKVWLSEGMNIYNRKDAREELRRTEEWIVTKLDFCFCCETCKEEWNENFNKPDYTEDSSYDSARMLFR